MRIEWSESPVYVFGNKYGSEGIEPTFDCKGGGCVSGSGTSVCGGYYGHREIGNNKVVITCHATNYVGTSTIKED